MVGTQSRKTKNPAMRCFLEQQRKFKYGLYIKWYYITNVNFRKYDHYTGIGYRKNIFLSASSAGGAGLTPGRGTEIPHAAWHGQKKKKSKRVKLEKISLFLNNSPFLSFLPHVCMCVYI